jgi:diguanylate cyclase (GGDEF)-like protein
MTLRPSAATRILVVEDELIVAADLCQLLEELGYTIVGSAATADDAVRMAVVDKPELVLMDIRLAGPRDGVQAATDIREQLGLPVIFLTANTDSRTVDRAIESNPGGYLAKPFNARTLLATIELTLRRHREERARQQQHRAEVEQLNAQNAELEGLAEKFRQESTIDPLTGLHNRRHLDNVMRRELSRARREHQSVGVIMLDIDRFKAFNDKWGHLAADEVLKSVSNFLKSRLRSYDVACRYGGEEIVIIAPGAGPKDALALAEHLREGIARLCVDYAGQRLESVTASFGVSAFPTHGVELEPLLLAADAALYSSKSAGRNRVSVAPSPSECE